MIWPVFGARRNSASRLPKPKYYQKCHGYFWPKPKVLKSTLSAPKLKPKFGWTLNNWNYLDSHGSNNKILPFVILSVLCQSLKIIISQSYIDSLLYECSTVTTSPPHTVSERLCLCLYIMWPCMTTHVTDRQQCFSSYTTVEKQLMHEPQT